MDEELPLHLKSGDFMEIMKDATDFDKNSLSYKHTFIALIDILGYKKLLDDLGEDAPKKLFEDILNAFSWAKASHESIKISLFSDTIIMEGIDDNAMNFWNIIQVLSALRLQLLQKGLLIRGAITYGNHFSHKGILVSPALVKAHELESQEAINPRVIICESALLNATENLVSKDGVYGLVVGKYFCKVERRMIAVDADGKNILAFDPNIVELRYLKYGEHPDKNNINHHVEHCINTGNMLLVQISNGIRIAIKRANTKAAISKLEYVVNEWNSYIDDFRYEKELKADYRVGKWG